MKNARGLAAVLAFPLGEVGSQSAGAYPTKPIKLVMTLVAEMPLQAPPLQRSALM